MATDKTPAHKRIKRAEAGRNDWKTKATERREEIEKLKKELVSKEEVLSVMNDQIHELKNALIKSSKQICEQDKMIDVLKKKSK